MPSPADKALPTARIRFASWEELARFVMHSDGRGLFVRTATPPPIGTELTLQLVLPDGRDLALPGRVAHRTTADSGGDPGMGVQITHMSAEQAERLQQLMSDPDVSRSLHEQQASQRPAAGAKIPAVPSAPPVPEQPPKSSLLLQAMQLLDRARFDTAERNVMDVLGDDPANVEAQKLLLIIQARRLRSQFDFDRATQKYLAVLKLDPENAEANEQVAALSSEIEHSKALFERVFGSGNNR